MKKNTTTFFLALIVLLVWGIVLYRLFGTTKEIEIVPVSPKIHMQEKESIKLSFNYKDPFKIPSRKPKDIAITKINIPEQPPAFKYKGLVDGTKRKLLIVENNGINKIIELRDSLLGFRIISINNDSMVVRQNVIKYSIIKK